jgi:SET domain-containing protein
MVEQEYTPILSPEQEADIDKIVEKAKKDLSGT